MPAPVNGTVILPAIFDLDSLEHVRDALASALEAGPVQVSAKAVERVATNALFLILSAADTARLTDRNFTLIEESDAFVTAKERLGLGAQFEPLLQS